ncbi:MAG: hypothetical protein FJ144_24755 [Deltaproteobacteria bacterium]|nr:hypothetical protein [Deltaproteobacteria bacterium]
MHLNLLFAAWRGPVGRTSIAAVVFLTALAALATACSRAEPPPAEPEATPFSSPSAAAAKKPELPNIVLISVDTLRRDHMSVYGYERETTPELAKLAGDGARFDTAYAHTATTGPSHATMLTARLPIGHGIDRNGVALRKDVRTLPEILKAEGYQTAAFISSYVLLGKFGYERGFEEYDIELDQDPGDRELTGCAEGKLERCADQTVDAVAGWLEKDRDPNRPLFLFIHLFDPHSGYFAPAAFREKFAGGAEGTAEADGEHGERDEAREKKREQRREKRQAKREALAKQQAQAPQPGASVPTDEKPKRKRTTAERLAKLKKGGLARMKSMPEQYDAEIAFADHELGRLLRVFDENGLRSDTIVMMTADHGEALGAHGVLTHGYVLFEEVLRVPLLVRYPEKIEPGIVIEEPVGLFDVMPTLLDLAGLENDPRDAEAPPLGGRSLAGALLGRDALDAERPIYLQRRHYATEKVLGRRVKGDAFGVRVGRWKYVESEGDGTRELYDLEADPLEEKNLIEEMPERADEMAKQLATWRAAHAEKGAVAPPRQEVSEGDREKLRALGYVD